MKFCTISDVHCHPQKPAHAELLLRFLNHPKVQECEKIFFLGDIFDVMVGHHNEYFKINEDFFYAIERLARSGIEIHYFEGNHDFHLKKLFKIFSKEKNLKNIFLHTNHLIQKIDHKKFYFSHGDDIEVGKFKYKTYKAFIKSLPLNLVADYIMPYKLLDFMGNSASQNSKKKNHNRYNDPGFCDETRSLFRYSASKAWKKHHFDYLFCGHAHISDLWKSPEGFTYANGGPCFLTQQFLHYDNGRIEVVKL